MSIGWKLRYLVLSYGNMSYYKDASSASERNPQGEITITSQSVVEPLSDTEEQSHQFTFCPVPGERVFLFAAMDAKERDIWVATLRRHIEIVGSEKQHRVELESKRKEHEEKQFEIYSNNTRFSTNSSPAWMADVLDRAKSGFQVYEAAQDNLHDAAVLTANYARDLEQIILQQRNIGLNSPGETNSTIQGLFATLDTMKVVARTLSETLDNEVVPTLGSITRKGSKVSLSLSRALSLYMLCLCACVSLTVYMYMYRRNIHMYCIQWIYLESK